MNDHIIHTLTNTILFFLIVMGFIRFALVLAVAAVTARLLMNYFNKGTYVVSLIEFSSKIDHNLKDLPFQKLREEVEINNGRVLQFLKVHRISKDSHSPDTLNLTTQNWNIVMIAWYDNEIKAKKVSVGGLNYYKNTERPVSRWYSVPFDCKSNTILFLLNVGLDIKGVFDDFIGVRPLKQAKTPHVTLKEDLSKPGYIYVVNLMSFRDRNIFYKMYSYRLLWQLAPTVGLRTGYGGKPLEDHWQYIAVVRYANFAAFEEMFNSKTYSELYVYRKKGIKEGIALLCSPIE